MNGTKASFLGLVLLAACAGARTSGDAAAPTSAPAPTPPPDLEALRDEVWGTELAFAATMADRDHEAFTSFLSEDAIFFMASGPLRGKAAVAEEWRPYFTGPAAPFAWEPDMVEVLASGDLALSSGPVFAPDGSPSGRFNSVWRLEGDVWRIVLDKGED